MASMHHNFGVFESEDPLDDALLDTVADLKNPPKVPQEVSKTFVNNGWSSLRERGFSVPKNNRFVEE